MSNRPIKLKVERIDMHRRFTGSIEQLTDLWDRSVRTTHHFLTDDNIAELRPWVGQCIKLVAEFAVMKAGRRLAGFVGVDSGKIEMLFVDPDFIGRGIGRMLLDWARQECGAYLIDVNEQNTQAAAIYRHWGFEVYERCETDDQGDPYPILKMRLKV